MVVGGDARRRRVKHAKKPLRRHQGKKRENATATWGANPSGLRGSVIQQSVQAGKKKENARGTKVRGAPIPLTLSPKKRKKRDEPFAGRGRHVALPGIQAERL